MQTLITYSQAQYIDEISQKKYKIPANILMERAGAECTSVFLEDFTKLTQLKIPPVKNILILCGSSNNGGDAQVVARLLSEKKNKDQNLSELKLEVVFLTQPKSPSAKEQFKMLQSHNVLYDILDLSNTLHTGIKKIQHKIKSFGRSDYIIDGISGIGQKGRFRYPQIIEAINTSCARVISIDVPTGLCENIRSEDKNTVIKRTINPVVNADICITIGLAKKIMYDSEYRKYCGEIKIVNPGFPEEVLHYSRYNPIDTAYRPLQVLEFSDVPVLWEKPNLNVYKHKRGVVAIAAGCKKSPGAAILALQAATRSAAGLVHGILDEDIRALAASACPSAITGTSVEDFFTDVKKGNVFHACVVGCGWGMRSPDTLEAFFDLPKQCPLILDADALRMLPYIYTKPAVQKKEKIITPHIGELKYLCKPLNIQTDDVLVMAEMVAHYYNAVVIAKSSLTYIVLPKNKVNNTAIHTSNYVVDGRCPALATGGSGDVLSGFLGSIVAYYSVTDNKNLWDNLHKASALSVILHAQAGKNIQEKPCNPNAQTIIEAISRVYSLV